MTTKFEQARGRPKPPSIQTGDYEKYRREHCITASIWKDWDGVWLVDFESIEYKECYSFEEALETLKEVMK